VKHSQILKPCLSVVIGLFFIGCAAKEPFPSFFVLKQSGDSGVRNVHGTSVFVRRVEVAPYLARTSLVEMRGGNQTVYAPTARWAEPLDQGVSRAVADNLRRSFGIQAYGFSPGNPPPDHAYDVTIRLERFEGNDNGDVVLVARWGVSSSGIGDGPTNRSTEIHRSGWKPGDYVTLARLLSEEVVDLSREIGRAIR
jgi:uncharacterized lipoprotein YmbA